MELLLWTAGGMFALAFLMALFDGMVDRMVRRTFDFERRR